MWIRPPSYSAISASRATIVDSLIDGMPVTPSCALTSPSCIAPLPLSDGSSSCSAMTPPHEPLVLQRLAQHPGADDRPAVVGEARGALLAQLGHLGQLRAVHAAGDRGQEADRDARVAGGGVAQRAQQRRGVERPGRCSASRGRAQNPPAAAAARAGLEVLLVLLARACAGGRAGRRRPGRGGGPAPRRSRRRRARSACPAAPISAISPSRTSTSRALVEAGARVEHVRLADQHVGGGAALCTRRRGGHQAGTPSGSASCSARAARTS